LFAVRPWGVRTGRTTPIGQCRPRNARRLGVNLLLSVCECSNAKVTASERKRRCWAVVPSFDRVVARIFTRRVRSSIWETGFEQSNSCVLSPPSIPASHLKFPNHHNTNSGSDSKPRLSERMATPMRHGPSQQGRTPSQVPGAVPTPPVSTPFNSQAQAAFSPSQMSRTSPQTLRKSPATSQTLRGLSDSAGVVNFDSPSATAALGALGIHDLGLDNLGVGTMGMGRSDEDDRKRRMDAITTMVKVRSSSEPVGWPWLLTYSRPRARAK
jgi:hypothetical protein